MTEITILMPAYNGIEFISRAISSVVMQTGCEWNLIVADDGSNDGTREYLRKLDDPRIRVIENEKNAGIFGNLNLLFSLASSPYIYILCQDDFFTQPNSLVQVLQLWRGEAKECAFIRFNQGADIKSKLGVEQAKLVNGIVSPDVSDLAFFIFGCIPGNLSNVSVKKSIFDSGEKFRQDLPYAGDFEYWSRLGRKFPWYVSSVVVAQVWNHPNQASFSLNKRGELVSQVSFILNGLFDNLIAAGMNSFPLKIMGTLHYSNQHRDLGLKKLATSGNFAYLAVVERQLLKAKFCFGPVGGWFVYVISLGGRCWRATFARHLWDRRSR